MFKPPPSLGDESELQPVVRCEARTHRELLDAAGVDTTGVFATLRRALCRGSRGRNIAFSLLLLVSVLFVLTSRGDDKAAYLYAPSKGYAEDAHLESVHWTHFHRGAPVIIVARDVASFLNSAMFVGAATEVEQEAPAGTPWFGTGTSSKYRLKQLQECLVARTTEANRTGHAVNSSALSAAELLAYDENGFPIEASGNSSATGKDGATHAPADEGLRVRVLPILTAAGGAPPASALFRQVPWSRLLLVLTGEGSLDAPSVACLVALQVSAVIGVQGEWYATHGGLAPPHRVHHVSVALPLRGLSAKRLADAAGRHDSAFAAGSRTTRFSLFLAPASAAADVPERAGTWTWWAGRRIMHTAPSEGVIVIAPASVDPRAPSAYTALDDAVLARLHHEHIHPSINATEIAATHTVRLTSELALVAPLTSGMGPLTRATSNAVLLTVRPDGFGVFRCPDVALAARISAAANAGRR